TGVAEGTVGVERIIKMLNVYNDQLVVDVKGIYSIEKFLISRRLMYWQVYLHKTVVSAEFLLINVLKRAKELTAAGTRVFATPTLNIFMRRSFTSINFHENILVEGKNILNWYSLHDDSDILVSIKEWQNHPDLVLSSLAKSLINRELFKATLQTKPIPKLLREKILKKITQQITNDKSLSEYFIMTGEITNSAYNRHNENIMVLNKNGKLKDIRQASDIDLSVFTKKVRKYYLCYPKELVIN
ncbi:MAG: phosphohydrolase, partial [Draconibacterium sp.]|nr:phosphohydrolase [Draconibacterium sp.]